ncbi:unnamed protein product, partial [Rotaria sordida]
QMFHESTPIEKTQSTKMKFEPSVEENIYHEQTMKADQSTANDKIEQTVKENVCHEQPQETSQSVANDQTEPEHSPVVIDVIVEQSVNSLQSTPDV